MNKSKYMMYQILLSFVWGMVTITILPVIISEMETAAKIIIVIALCLLSFLLNTVQLKLHCKYKETRKSDVGLSKENDRYV